MALVPRSGAATEASTALAYSMWVARNPVSNVLSRAMGWFSRWTRAGSPVSPDADGIESMSEENVGFPAWTARYIRSWASLVGSFPSSAATSWLALLWTMRVSISSFAVGSRRSTMIGTSSAWVVAV